MKPKVKKPKEAVPQIEKFKALARDVECDDDQEAFRERVKKIAKAPKAAPI